MSTSLGLPAPDPECLNGCCVSFQRSVLVLSATSLAGPTHPSLGRGASWTPTPSTWLLMRSAGPVPLPATSHGCGNTRHLTLQGKRLPSHAGAPSSSSLRSHSLALLACFPTWTPSWLGGGALPDSKSGERVRTWVPLKVPPARLLDWAGRR